MNSKAVVLDFDGVILQSMEVKTRAFAALFSSEKRADAARIVAYHLRNGGISRFEKFRWAYREVLKRPLPPEREAELGRRFNLLVEEEVIKAPWVPGAREFLESHSRRVPLFVASGTPEEEMRRIVDRRAMGGYFQGVFGSPTPKAEILTSIARSLGLPTGALTMVGDAKNDLDAALRAGTAFIGVSPHEVPSPFPEGTRVLPDLTGLGAELER